MIWSDVLSPNALAYLATRPWVLGDLATWIGALANVATVILALTAAIVGYRVYKVESGRDARAELDRRERAADDRRAQAALVSAWYGRSAEASEAYGGQWRMYAWGAWVLNASDSPIYDVFVMFYLRGSKPMRVWRSERIRVVPPYRGEQLVGMGDEAQEQLTEDEWKNQLDVSLEFRDGASRHWMRDRQGYLQELPSMPVFDQR